MSDSKKILLIGGTGFVGKKIAAQLVTNGYEVIVPTRFPAHAKELSVLPRLKLVPSDVHNPQALAQLMSGLSQGDAVINLVGILHDRPGVPYGKNFAKNHVELTRSIVQALKQANLTRYIHMSALGADSQGPSMYQRSKGDAEQIVKQSGLRWTIFRPSVIFGRDDRFINLFATLLKFAPLMPLAGYHAKFQPVSVHDVAKVFVMALTDERTVHQAYDLAGPHTYRLSDLVRFAGKMSGISRPVVPLPNCVGKIQAFFIEKMPGPTLMSRDNIDSMKVDNILPGDGNPIRDVFGFEPEPLESLLR